MAARALASLGVIADRRVCELHATDLCDCGEKFMPDDLAAAFSARFFGPNSPLDSPAELVRSLPVLIPAAAALVLAMPFSLLDVAVIALGSYIFFVLCAIASSRYAWAYLHLWAQSRVMEEQVLSGSGRVGAAAPRGLAVAHAIMHLDGRMRREARRLWFVSARVLRTHTQDNV